MKACVRFWENTNGFQYCKFFSVVLILKRRLLKAIDCCCWFYSFWVRERISVLSEVADAAMCYANCFEGGRWEVLFPITIRLLDLKKKKKKSPLYYQMRSKLCPGGSCFTSSAPICTAFLLEGSSCWWKVVGCFLEGEHSRRGGVKL